MKRWWSIELLECRSADSVSAWHAGTKKRDPPVNGWLQLPRFLCSSMTQWLPSAHDGIST